MKEVSKANRKPFFEGSIYEMNWKEEEKTEAKTEKTSVKNSEWLILSYQNRNHLKRISEALKELEVDEENINVKEMTGGDMIHDFQQQITTKIESMNCADKELVIVNLLPTIAHGISSENELFLSAQWLSFESTLETLKAVTAMELTNCKIVAVTCQVMGYDVFDKKSSNIPWAATPLGLSRVTNLETKIPVICVDLNQNPCKDDYVMTFKSLDDHSVEEGLIVSTTKVQKPIFERVAPGKVSHKILRRCLHS